MNLTEIERDIALLDGPDAWAMKVQGWTITVEYADYGRYIEDAPEFKVCIADPNFHLNYDWCATAYTPKGAARLVAIAVADIQNEMSR